MATVRTKKKENSLKPPNEEQFAVINFGAGYACVVAGPGSGKSFALVQRFARLVSDGISPEDILSLTFTNTAAKNLRERVEDRVGKLSINRTGSGSMTFHGLALKFAEEERNEYPFELSEFPLATDPVANKLSGESARKFELDPRSLRSVASLYRRRRVCPRAAVRDAESKLDPKQLKLALAYKDYCKRQESEGLLDFDSLIYHMVEILDKKPEVRARWKRNWLQLDECQDMSKIEWDLARLVSGISVLAVGDVSQGIYGFRGSDPRLFTEMETIFPGTKTLYLATNYRSTPEIIDYIRPISRSRELAEKFHTPNQSGPVPQVVGFSSSTAEAEFVVKCIKEGL
jgi:DNA helicase-2/ATP-dependent DNA helicase PcrA